MRSVSKFLCPGFGVSARHNPDRTTRPAMNAADAAQADRLHPGALLQGKKCMLYAHGFMTLAKLPMNCCETLITLRTCFVLSLARDIRSRFDWQNLPQTLEEVIDLALDFEATGSLEQVPPKQTAPKESPRLELNPTSAGLRDWFSVPSLIPSPPIRVRAPAPGAAPVNPIICQGPGYSQRPSSCPGFRSRSSLTHLS